MFDYIHNVTKNHEIFSFVV